MSIMTRVAVVIALLSSALLAFRMNGIKIGLTMILLYSTLPVLNPLSAQPRGIVHRLDWPSSVDQKQCRPWVYWWWMGSAVNQKDLTRVLASYRKAGLGGVHIIPIYGVKGEEDRFIPFLSERWVEMLAHTFSEAERLGLGVDMTCGTGWPFGGPGIKPGQSASRFELREYRVRSGRRLGHPIRYSDGKRKGKLVVLLAFQKSGGSRDLTGLLDAGGRLDWVPAEGDWRLYALFSVPYVKEVERAAPGGEGFAIDYFSRTALSHYLDRFDRVFRKISGRPRAFYNDSFEIPRANWTSDFLSAFQRLRGYDLRWELPALAGNETPDRVARVKADFRHTLSDLLLEEFVIPWTEWAHRWGSLTRNQAHGMPGNLLDLYASADIPETESFGPSGFPIPGLRIDPDFQPEEFGRPDKLVFKFASSAAHVAGKPLVASESATWLAEHFKVALSQVKPELDQLFLGGINQVFFHGIPFSPPDEPWPGWLFYASTHFGPTNTFWSDFQALNSYVARVQAFLRSGRPANDLLLYFPIHDIWHDSKGLQKPLTVHKTKDWLEGTIFYKSARELDSRGYSFDYISDRQILNLEVDGSNLRSAGGQYAAIVVPAARRMPLGTLAKLQGLARRGASVIFLDSLPVDVPGLSNLRERRIQLRQFVSSLEFRPTSQGVEEALQVEGRFLRGSNLQSLLAGTRVSREPMTDLGLQFIRRQWADGHLYFCANLTAATVEGWIGLGTPAESAAILDPLSHSFGLAATRPGSGGFPEVYVQLRPGESLILKTLRRGRFDARRWRYLEEVGNPVPIEGAWNVRFEAGGPATPAPLQVSSLGSWTSWQGKVTECFSGTAVYSIHFQAPRAEALILDLGRVAESARVSLNGRVIGTVFAYPLRIDLRDAPKEGVNLLDIEVSNLMANRIRCMDLQKRFWKRFYDINFVSIRYKPFDASGWQPMDSGLLGPVRLIPARILDPMGE